MSKDEMIFRSLPIQWLFIAIVVPLMIGCSNTHKQRQDAVAKSFTNQTVQVKATTYMDQFIVRCEDGSVWEVKANANNLMPIIIYKNCLFDPLYSLPPLPLKPVDPPLPPLPLEK